MRATLILGSMALATMAQADRLSVDYSTMPATSVTTRACECEVRDVVLVNKRASGHSRPGSISLDISGGTPPYSITWHTTMNATGTRISAWAGMHRVTVIDAAGERVTRSIHVGKSRLTIAPLCPPCPKEYSEPAPVIAATVSTKPPKPHVVRPVLNPLVETKHSNFDLGGVEPRKVRTTEHTGGRGGGVQRPVQRTDRRR